MSGNVLGAGSLALVKLLLNANPHARTLNARDQSGATALLRVLNSHESDTLNRTRYFTPLVDLLLEHEAHKSVHDNQGQTALHKLPYSASYNDPISPTLLEKSIPFVDINQADADGCGRRCIGWQEMCGKLKRLAC